MVFLHHLLQITKLETSCCNHSAVYFYYAAIQQAVKLLLLPDERRDGCYKMCLYGC